MVARYFRKIKYPTTSMVEVLETTAATA